MNYAKNRCWLDSGRLVAELQEDGSVVFPENVTELELKEAIKLLFHGLEIARQWSIELCLRKSKDA